VKIINNNAFYITNQLRREDLFFETWSTYIGQAGGKLTILLSPPSKCYDYRPTPPCVARRKDFELTHHKEMMEI
jgi:hypothetical protein